MRRVKIQYPQTYTVECVETLHNTTIRDPYRWLENLESLKVQEWIREQNKLSKSILTKIPGREVIDKELKRVFEATSISLPYIYQEKYFFAKHEKGQNHPVLYVRKGSFKAKPQKILDPNKFSKDGTVALDWFSPSQDGVIVAYGKSLSGSEESTLYILNIDTGKHLSDIIPNTRACSIAWLKDKSGFFYSRYPEKGTVPEGDEKYYRRIYFHKLGTSPEKDTLVFGGDRPKEEWPSVYLSEKGSHLFITVTPKDWMRNDLYIKNLETDDEIIPIAESMDGIFYANLISDRLIILTNYNAPKYRVMATDLKHLDIDDWREIIPEGNAVIKDFKLIGNKLVLTVEEDVHSRILVYSLDGKFLYEIPLPTLGTATTSGRWDKDELFYCFTSFFYPTTIYHFDLKTKEKEKIFQMDIGAEFDNYTLKQVWYESKDKNKIPMFVMHHKELELNGQNPTILTGYGGFGLSWPPYFDRTLLPWLSRGGVYGVANIRGGEEFGKKWWEAGRRGKKQNCFDDFIQAAEWLILHKYTNPNKLAIEGGSNGGLLVGAAMTQRPELFRAVVCSVPLLDMLRYHKFLIARLWISEYGCADTLEEFKWLYSYSPYHKIDKSIKYPAVYLTAAESDTRAHPSHALKMTAKLQAIAKENPVLLYVEPKAGHGAGKPIKKVIEDIADKYMFIAWQLGIDVSQK